MERVSRRGNWVLANEWLHAQCTQKLTFTIIVITIIVFIVIIIVIIIIRKLQNKEKQNTKNSFFHCYHCVVPTSTKCDNTCRPTRAKLQTFRQGTQIIPQRSTPNHGKQKSCNTTVFIAARSHARGQG